MKELIENLIEENGRLETLAQGYLAELVSTRMQRDAYQQVADTMAAAHKVERDGLALDAVDKQIMIDGQRIVLARLKAERDALAHQVNRLESDLRLASMSAVRQELEINELMREQVGLRLDAERYRAVRFQDCEITGVRHAVFDAAIDGAIKETK